MRLLLIAIAFGLCVLSACGGGGKDDVTQAAPQSEVASAPVATVAAQNIALVGNAFTLDGAGSLGTGGVLSYAWRLVTPPGSTARMDDPGSAQPSFVPDVVGVYTAYLVVEDHNGRSSETKLEIQAKVLNLPPVAVAGGDFSMPVGQEFQFNGQASHDPNGDALTYRWRMYSRPDGSQSALVGSDTPAPSFKADVAGEYQFELVVSDGLMNSSPSLLRVTTFVPNQAPVVVAPNAVSGVVGLPLTLDASGSRDPEGDPIRPEWMLTKMPEGSFVRLDVLSPLKASFTPDVSGSYSIMLSVFDELGNRSGDHVIQVEVQPLVLGLTIEDVPNDSNAWPNTYSAQIDWQPVPGATRYVVYRWMRPVAGDVVAEPVGGGVSNQALIGVPCSGLGRYYQVAAYAGDVLLGMSDFKYHAHKLGRLC